MKMTYTKSAFEMPDGKYLAKFIGTTLREEPPGAAPRLGQDGKPLPPAMTWDFEIAEGPETGKKADKLTGRIPTHKSGCGKMLAAVSDSILKDGQEIDLQQFVGMLYRITVLENRVSDNPAPVRVYGSANQPSAEFPKSPTIAGGGTHDPATGQSHQTWDVSDGTNVLKGQTPAQVQAFIDEFKLDAGAIRVKPAGAPRDAAKLASECGFRSFNPAEDPIPF